MQDENGNQISFEEWEYNNKYIPYKSYEWPVNGGQDFMQVFSSFGKEQKLAHYRYPVQVGQERKGIVFFVHGYGCNTYRHAFLAQMFA